MTEIRAGRSAKERLLNAISELKGLDEVERLVADKFQSDAPLLEEIPAYLFGLGGKRMRPILTLMTAQAFGMNVPSRALIEVSAGIELIHMATLLHDDIIDHSPLRRHQSSPYARYGVSSTLLAGDFLLVRAFSLCARLDHFIIDETERACIDLTEGEILETPLFKENHSLESSLRIATKKTASLFRLATCSAAHLAGISADQVDLLADFGEQLGIAFQILDDVLDVTSAEELLGKKAGMDLRERKPSVVNVLWLESSSGLAQLLKTPLSHEEENLIEMALNELRESPAVEKARSLAASYAAEALRNLERAAEISKTVVPTGLDALRSLLDYTIERVQ